jgi:DNA-binding transcriptional regulator YiaG
MNDVVSFAHAGSPISEPLHYTGCGLNNIYLASGYQVREVAGERYVSIRDLEDLHRAIALFLVSHRKVLSGQEIRFLRKHLGFTQKKLGGRLRVSDQSVARYEKDQTVLEGPADALLRLLVLGSGECINVPDTMDAIDNSDDFAGTAVTLALDHDEWRVAA